jgi:hypothetical protein
MALLDDRVAPNRFELWVRFGIGAGVGALLTGITLAVARFPAPGLLAAAVACSALAFGILARQLGDRFWNAAQFWLWLLWP